MATRWHAEGEYMEACSCDFLCPCIVKNMTTPATHDFCKVALGFRIDSGQFGGTPLGGVRFVMFAQTKAVMGTGEWSAGLVIDSAASDAQVGAVQAIATAAGNGPLGRLAPLISDFRGVERRPIEFRKQGRSVSMKIDGLLDQAVVGIDSLSAPGECIAIDNTGHPVNKRLALATAARNVIKAFGIDWRGEPDRNNGHFAPFAWEGEAV
jgi:hypothetical protein